MKRQRHPLFNYTFSSTFAALRLLVSTTTFLLKRAETLLFESSSSPFIISGNTAIIDQDIVYIIFTL